MELEDLQGKTEEEFRGDIILPLLRTMDGVDSVKEVHGVNENGKDFVFRVEDEFGERTWKAIQAKVGDVGGGAAGVISTLKDQAELALEMPYDNDYEGTQEYISEIYIITNGNITDNASRQIRERIHNRIKGSVYFVDGSKVLDLIEEHMNPAEMLLYDLTQSLKQEEFEAELERSDRPYQDIVEVEEEGDIE